MVDQIVARFGDALLIDSNRMHEEDVDGFRVAHGMHSHGPKSVVLPVPPDHRAVQLLLERRAFIFDRIVEGQSQELEGSLGGSESAALHLTSVPQRILAFGLRSGW